MKSEGQPSLPASGRVRERLIGNANEVTLVLRHIDRGGRRFDLTPDPFPAREGAFGESIQVKNHPDNMHHTSLGEG